MCTLRAFQSSTQSLNKNHTFQQSCNLAAKRQMRGGMAAILTQLYGAAAVTSVAAFATEWATRESTVFDFDADTWRRMNGAFIVQHAPIASHTPVVALDMRQVRHFGTLHVSSVAALETSSGATSRLRGNAPLHLLSLHQPARTGPSPHQESHSALLSQLSAPSLPRQAVDQFARSVPRPFKFMLHPCRIGDEGMLHLMLHCSVFETMSTGELLQIAGPPLDIPPYGLSAPLPPFVNRLRAFYGRPISSSHSINGLPFKRTLT